MRRGVGYIAGERRRRRRGLPIGVAVELRVALLLGDALAGGREAILVPLVVLVRRVPLPLRYHRRRCDGERAVSPGRLDCCTGRARLGDGAPLLGGNIRGVVCWGAVVCSEGKSRHQARMWQLPSARSLACHVAAGQANSAT